MKRRALTFAGSVVLFVASAFMFASPGRALSAGWHTSRPTIIGGGTTPESNLLLIWSPMGNDDNPTGPWSKIELLGFLFQIRRLGRDSHVVVVSLPWWLVMGMLTMLCLAAFIPLKLHLHRVRNGLCLNCGYDKRTTPNQCPECGALSGSLPP